MNILSQSNEGTTHRSLVVDPLPILSDRFTVRFHIPLLEVIRKLVEILVVGKEDVSLCAVEAVVPDTYDTKKDREVAVEWCLFEMLVHPMCTVQQLLRVLITNVECNREPSCTPQTVPPTHPVPELSLVNAECSDSFCDHVEGDKVLCNVRSISRARQEALSGRLSIGGGLLCGECLADDDEQCVLRVAPMENLCEMCTIDIGYEAYTEV